MKLKPVLLNVLLWFLLINVGQLSAASENSNQTCLRCHSMKTLSYRDSVTNSIVSLYVDSVQFNNSNHGELSCTDCHDNDGFRRYPHSVAAKSEKLYCTDCHESSEFEQFKFKQRETEFNQSIHHKKLGSKFTCFNCHDPHTFKTTAHDRNIKNMVRKDNEICLSCHASPIQLTNLTDQPPKDLLIAHNWLPNTQLHWQSVRCLECHTPPNSDIYSHDILSANQAVKKCEECHTQNSILFSKLYRFKTAESRQKIGFLKTLMYNTPYVIGMTKDPLIDQISIIIFILLVLGISVHGIGRWLTLRRKNK